MAQEITINGDSENRTDSSIPRSTDTLCQKATLVSFWFAVFTPGVVEAVFKNTIYLDYYGANPASYGLFSVLLYVWACFANIYIGQIIDSVQILPGVFPPEKWGRRAPWILILLPLYFIVTFFQEVRQSTHRST